MFLLNKRCFHPKYWALALVLALFWLLARLPASWQLALGRGLGRSLHACSSKIRHIVRANLRACFPDESDTENHQSARHACEELGMSIMETFRIWFRDSDAMLDGRVRWEGEAHLQALLEQDRGIIVIACHFGSVDVNGALLNKAKRGDRQLIGTFRDTDPVVTDFLHSVRGEFSDRMLSAMDQRGVVKALRKKSLVWYAPDIEVKTKTLPSCRLWVSQRQPRWPSPGLPRPLMPL